MNEHLRRIAAVEALSDYRLRIIWVQGPRIVIDLRPLLKRRAFKALADEREFAAARVDEWGHSVAWPSGVDIGADSLWLESLSAEGRTDTRAFLEWRQRHGLSLTEAARALGLSRRMVAYYSSGEKPVPRHILLACRGWEVSDTADAA